MIRALSNLLVRAAELAEAEGRVARRECVRFIKLTLYYIVTCVLATVGLLVVGAGLFMALTEVMAPAAALLAVGGGILALGLTALLLGKQQEH